MADEALVEEVARSLVPLVERAISDAVAEAQARIVVAVPMDGVIDAVDGATAQVSVPDQAERVPCTLANAALGTGDRVVILFFANGIAYAFGPIPGPPPPI